MHFTIEKSRLFGRVVLSSSKSHTLRAILFASLASGTSTIYNQLQSPDQEAMIQACRVLGAHIDGTNVVGRTTKILHGSSIDAHNSGIVLRFIGACACLSDQLVHITGDASIQTRRIVQPLMHGLQQLGGYAVCCNGFAPIAVRGPLKPGYAVIDGQDSQPVSALLIASSLVCGQTVIEVNNLGERPWIALTLDWLKRMGIQIEVDANRFVVNGQEQFSSFEYTVPGDLSTLGFLLVAALICESDLVIENVDLDDVQGDKIIIEILKRMGAVFQIDARSIRVQGPQQLVGCDIDVNDCIDALPILAVAACFARGKTTLSNGHMCRFKESDRIRAMAQELNKMGAKITERDDGLCIEQSILKGTQVSSHDDHRIALSLAVAGLAVRGKTIVENCSCIKKSYPSFFEDMKRLCI